MSFAYSNDYEEIASVRIPKDGQFSADITQAIALLHSGLKKAYESVAVIGGEDVEYPIVVQMHDNKIYFYRTKTHVELREHEERMEASRIHADEAKQERLKKEEEMAASLGVDVETYRAKLKEHRGW